MTSSGKHIIKRFINITAIALLLGTATASCSRTGQGAALGGLIGGAGGLGVGALTGHPYLGTLGGAALGAGAGALVGHATSHRGR